MHWIPNLIRKNLIILVFIFIAVSFNFYNSYSDITTEHPKFKLESVWYPIDDNLFYDVNLIGKSILDEQYYLSKSINSILRDNSTNESNVSSNIVRESLLNNPEIFFGINIENENFINEDTYIERSDFNILNIFRYFTQENAKSFFYNHIQYSKENINKGFDYKYDDALITSSTSPYGIKIVFLSQTNDVEKEISKIKDFMYRSNQNFNKDALSRILIFTDFVKNDNLAIIEKLKNRILIDDEEKLSEIIDTINYSVEKIEEKENLLQEIYELNEFTIFKNSKNNINSLKRSMQIKILTNLASNIFILIFLGAVVIFLRENFYKIINHENNQNK